MRCLILTKAGRATLLSQAGMKYLCTAQPSCKGQAREGLSEVMETAALPSLLCETTHTVPKASISSVPVWPSDNNFSKGKFRGEISIPKIHLSVAIVLLID